jgi:quercetin dioxygenase-like cupin family protein
MAEVGKSWQIVRSGEATRSDIPWGEIRWLASAALGNSPQMTFGKVVIRAGERNPSHRHTNCWELLYLLTGRLRHRFGSDSAEMAPGDLAVIPPGLPHWAEALPPKDAVMVVAYSAGERGMEEL